LMQRMAEAGNIKIHFNVNVARILGESRVSGIVFTDAAGKEEQLDVEGVFVEIGFTVNAALIQGLTELDQRKQIIIDDHNGTSVPGLFAAGDVTTIEQKQVVISAGEGAKAALAANQYLQSRGVVKRGVRIDWGIKPPEHFKSVGN
jgi:alkyl hydroperoxide reductase subunit AhpF